MNTLKVVSLFVVLPLGILSPGFGLAQVRPAPVPASPEEPATKFERFTARKGVILVKEFHDIGQVLARFGSPVKVKVVVSFQIGSQDKIFALAVQQDVKYGTNTAVLDFDEAEGLAQAFPHMLKTFQAMTQQGGQPYTEVFFQGRGPFKAGFYVGGISGTGYYVQLSNVGTDRTAFVESEQFTELGEFIKAGVAKMRALGAR